MCIHFNKINCKSFNKVNYKSFNKVNCKFANNLTNNFFERESTLNSAQAETKAIERIQTKQ